MGVEDESALFHRAMVGRNDRIPRCEDGGEIDMRQLVFSIWLLSIFWG